MAAVTYDPPEAEIAGCVATAEIISSESVSGVGWTGHVDRFRLSSVDAPGYILSGWRVTVHVTDTDWSGRKTEYDTTFDVQGNPFDETGRLFNDCFQHSYQYADSPRTKTQVVTSVVARYVSETAHYKASAEAVPIDAKNAGCRALVNGLPTFEATGIVGEEVDVTLEAFPAIGWKFIRWKRDGEVISRNDVEERTELMSNQLDVFRASFVQDDGKILCDSGGNVLASSGGAVLCRG